MARSDSEQADPVLGIGGARSDVRKLAPTGDVAEYDRRHLALYAELLDAADVGHDWRHAAREILRIDVTAEDAEACWRSHLDRARWIIGDGLGAAMTAFGTRPVERSLR